MNNAHTNENKFAIPAEHSPFEISIEVAMNETFRHLTRDAGLTPDTHPTFFVLLTRSTYKASIDAYVDIQYRSTGTLLVTWDNIAIIESIVAKYIARENRKTWESQRSEKTQLTKFIKSAKSDLELKSANMSRHRDIAISQARNAARFLNANNTYTVRWVQDTYNAGLITLEAITDTPEVYYRDNIVVSCDVRSYFRVVDGTPKAYYVLGVHKTLDGDDKQLNKFEFDSLDELLIKATQYFDLCIEFQNAKKHEDAVLAIEALNAASISLTDNNNNN